LFVVAIVGVVVGAVDVADVVGDGDGVDVMVSEGYVVVIIP